MEPTIIVYVSLMFLLSASAITTTIYNDTNTNDTTVKNIIHKKRYKHYRLL